jgi:hypothetical protein
MIAAPSEWFSSAQDKTAQEVVEGLSRQAHAEDLQALSFSMNAALVAASDAWIGQGYASPIEWVRRDCKMTGGEVADRMCVGLQAAAIRESIDALISGDIGFAHLVVIARTAEALRESKTSKGFDEQRLLERARTEDSLTRFNNYCMHYRHSQDPEGYAEDELAGIESRKLKMSSGKQGMVHISAWLDPAGAAAVRTALELLARKHGADDDRERERRMADALVEVAMQTLDRGGLPMQSNQRPHLQVTTTLETLLGLAGSPAAEMEFSLPISSRMVERIACDCAVTRILLGSDSTVIDVGRARRHLRSDAESACRPGPALRVARMRPRCHLHRGSPPSALDPQRWDRPRQPRALVLLAPPAGARGALADRAHGRRPGGGDPAAGAVCCRAGSGLKNQP